MRAKLKDYLIFLGVILANLLFYKQIQRFFRSIYERFEKRVTNKHGLECPIALRHWPEGYNYMVLIRATYKSRYCVWFFNKDPEFWLEENGSSYWIAQYPYNIKYGKDIPFGPATKHFDSQYLGQLKWER
jgi:hypothetical protein